MSGKRLHFRLHNIGRLLRGLQKLEITKALDGLFDVSERDCQMGLDQITQVAKLASKCLIYPWTPIRKSTLPAYSGGVGLSYRMEPLARGGRFKVSNNLAQ